MTNKNILDKRFKHHKWFKEGVTVKHALDYFAKSGDFYLSKKPSKIQSDRLFDDINYDDMITDGNGNYRISQEEIDYYLTRKEYWKEQKEADHQKWLNEEIDADKKLSNYLCMNTHYDLEGDEKQLYYWKYKNKDNEVDKIKFWENSIKRTTITKKIIDDLISEIKNSIKTNRDFENFKEIIKQELSKVVEYNGRGYVLIIQ